jgi:hypothetical protein
VPVVGTLDVTSFRVVNGVLNGVGTFTGTVGGQQVPQSFTAPVAPQQATGSCQILDLVLGPLDLDLLGLVVDLNQVHLNITAQQGSGNLLGNLLCSVAHLLDGNGSGAGLQAILGRLNQILGGV